MAKRSRERSRSGQDIGPIPEVKDWERRNSCRLDLAKFLKTYFNDQFLLPFCRDHFSVIEKAQRSVLQGGLFAVAMPRGSGKSQIVKGTTCWAVIYGHRYFPLLLGATAEAALELLDGVKGMLEFSPILLEDFPEAIYPIVKLEGESRRQTGQRCNGERTSIAWAKKFIVMPRVPHGNWIDGETIGPAPCAGATIHVAGITGRIRGFNIQGRRPDLVIPDDPQTDEAAYSVAGRVKTERTLAGAVLGLAGPGKKIAGIMPCTVIAEGDAMDCVLSHEKHPEWDSSRTKLLYSFPVRMDLWEKYREIRHDYDPTKTTDDKTRAASEATKFYADNRGAMQEGADVAWEWRRNPDELDALQNCMNLFFQDKQAFHAEYQNDPLPVELGSSEILKAPQIAAKLSGFDRKHVPIDTNILTCGIDVQMHSLWWTVCAWSAETFTGYVVDYGVYPGQGSLNYFRNADIQNTLARFTKVQGLEAQIYAGLTGLTAELLGNPWNRGIGQTSVIDRCLIDLGYQTDVIYKFARESQHKAVILPSHGRGISASQAPMSAWTKKPGDRVGLNWYISTADKRASRFVMIDVNFWKSFVHSRLLVPKANPGCLTLFGNDERAHRMYSDHMVSEYPSIDNANGRTVNEWKAKPGKPDNHWLDCTVYAAVAASIQGASLKDVHQPTSRPQGPRKKFSEQYAEKKLERERGGR